MRKISRKLGIILGIFIILISSNRVFAKYELAESMLAFYIEPAQEETFYITGNILTENMNGVYTATVTVYKTGDTRTEGDATDPREVIAQIETNDDGSFAIPITETTQYDVLITKSGYLDYRIIEIEVNENENIVLEEYKMIAGDVTGDNQIEISDLVGINTIINSGLGNEVDEANEMYDFNGDGVIDASDRTILKRNYGKVATTVQWSK